MKEKLCRIYHSIEKVSCYFAEYYKYSDTYAYRCVSDCMI